MSPLVVYTSTKIYLCSIKVKPLCLSVTNPGSFRDIYVLICILQRKQRNRAPIIRMISRLETSFLRYY